MIDDYHSADLVDSMFSSYFPQGHTKCDEDEYEEENVPLSHATVC